MQCLLAADVTCDREVSYGAVHYHFGARHEAFVCTSSASQLELPLVKCLNGEQVALASHTGVLSMKD